jgi:formate dehydrogenase subunit gamma
MKSIVNRLRALSAAIAMAGALVLAAPAVEAQPQPNSVNPTAAAVKEDQLLRTLQQVDGRVSIPDSKSGTLIQPAGQDWRNFHQGTLRLLGAVAILGMLGVLVAFYLKRGMVRIEAGRSGARITRFNGFERAVHWMTASCFIVLAISGLNVTFGKSILMPILGEGAFATWSQAAKYAHNYLSFPFSLGVLVIFFMWVAGNIPNASDLDWVKRGGGLIGGDHPPAHRFNAGQKLMYWIVVLGGAAVAITGYMMMFPFMVTDLAGMQTAQMIHGIVAMLYVAAMIAHVYIGTLGMEGAFESMGEGQVDVNWAKQHHKLWADQEIAKQKASPAE